ncbi:protoporphyrinogen oxidase [Desmospora profundinema]|uniref:Coproporphyrinogen III oxidase n=1 Tax=Desmospora profundinema TaxID=1571184 RepID=A0ABU1IKS1_9BACL|nr:protoporphyrinogen oxidase [Desmospora profundinema]MDR6224410.1 oxygen-dependent protoporphyrinogen oxidase [Desmospora profundinema]
MSTPRIAILGGGITGLSAAFYLLREAGKQGIQPRITLLEADTRLGGKIQTERFDGFVMETGPDSFLERKASAKQLAVDLGLEDRLVRNRTGQAYILRRGELLPIPEGAVMGIPTRLSPFVTTPLFSPAAKLRAAGDLILPRRHRDGDISVGRFFRQRLGNEVVDQLIEPLLSGIYAGDIDQLSLMATFPQFAALEEKHRSLILGMKRTRPTRSDQKPQGMFLTLKDGLESLVDALAATLPQDSVRLSMRVERIEKNDGRYRLFTQTGETLEADAVLMTLPQSETDRLFSGLDVPKAGRTVPAASVATVILAYDADAARLEKDGTGFVVPRREPTTITACTWTHKKWPHTTPEGKALIRCYVGRSGDEAIVHESDEAIVSAVRRDLHSILGISETPLFTRVTRWKQAMPQYTPGHAEWVARLREKSRCHLPGIFWAGASFSGIGIPDCIDQGKQAAIEAIQYIHDSARKG